MENNLAVKIMRNLPVTSFADNVFIIRGKISPEVIPEFMGEDKPFWKNSVKEFLDGRYQYRHDSLTVEIDYIDGKTIISF